MIRRTGYLALITLFLALLATTSWAQTALKIGVIDTQLVLEEYERAKIAMKKLDSERDRLRGKGQELVDQLRDMQEKLVKQRKFLDEDQVTQTENDIRIKQTEIESFTTTAQDTLDDMQQQLFDPVITEVETHILELGKTEKFDLLLRKQLSVLYVRPEMDLTERVLKELNGKFAAATGTETTKSNAQENPEKEPANPQQQK